MTDKELLHAAAKAAGIDVGGWNSDLEALFCDASYFWNPLADDGDALRLAVKLQFGLSIEGRVTLVHNRDGVYKEQSQDFNGDANAATRRAITRAAAALSELGAEHFGAEGK
jgi:hypothetical protein